MPSVAGDRLGAGRRTILVRIAVLRNGASQLVLAADEETSGSGQRAVTGEQSEVAQQRGVIGRTEVGLTDTSQGAAQRSHGFRGDSLESDAGRLVRPVVESARRQSLPLFLRSERSALASNSAGGHALCIRIVHSARRHGHHEQSPRPLDDLLNRHRQGWAGPVEDAPHHGVDGQRRTDSWERIRSGSVGGAQ